MRLTGQQLFLRYAFPCANWRLSRGFIDKIDLANLKKFVWGKDYPSPDFLKRCFPEAFRKLREFARSRKREMWDVDVVADFWRHHHNHLESPVYCGEVTKINKTTGIVTVVVKGVGEMMASNWYGIRISIGDSVFTHQHVIIEDKDEKC